VLSGWHVDSVAGDDGDAGTYAAPLKTIAALLGKAIQAGDAIWLKRGSSWRERIYGLPNNTSVRAYGDASDPKPILDGADIIPAGSFTKTDGQTNVYQLTLTWAGSEWATNNGLRIWEDGATSTDMLTHVADVATCDATPGSWAGEEIPTTNPTTVYIHPTASDDPGTSGSVYSTARRIRAGAVPLSRFTRCGVTDSPRGAWPTTSSPTGMQKCSLCASSHVPLGAGGSSTPGAPR
jgi:hypothetical protein